MSPRELKNLYDEQDAEDSTGRNARLSLRFAKRVKPLAPNTQFTTKARHAQRRHGQTRNDAR